MLRRTFAKSIAIGLGGAVVPALPAAARKLEIGHTALTWNAGPRSPEPLGEAVQDIAELGYHSWETFAEVLGDWDAKGTLGPLIEKYKIQLKSGYLSTDLLDPARQKETVAQITRLSTVIKKHGGTYLVLASSGIKRPGYNFKEHRGHIVAALNDYAKAVVDAGLGTGFHQHTGTAIDTEEEVYGLMEAVDTRYCKFAPDVGQLQKGGSDPVKIVKHFLPILDHMHLKDFVGGEAGQGYSGYCPLGQGKVDLAAILNLMEGAGHSSNIMVELDRSAKNPVSARQTAVIAKSYLEKLGYTFRA